MANMAYVLNPTKVPSLQDTCLANTCSLLRTCHWRLDGKDGIENPFSHVPPQIIHQLLHDVLKAETGGTSRVDVLWPLLTSGRITNFVADYIEMTSEEAGEVIHILSHYASAIRKVSLHLLIHKEHWPLRGLITHALNNFFPECSNLEHLSCSEHFYVKNIRQYSNLRFLEAPFETVEKVFTRQMGDPSPCYNLTHVRMLYSATVEVVIKLLQCCPNLTVLDNDIAGALEALHGKDFETGNLNKTYRLQKYVLGADDMWCGEDDFHKPLENDVSVRIAAITCPLTKNILIWTEEHESLAALENFKTLESLRVEWVCFGESGDFHPGLATALQSIGKDLKKLHTTALRVDFVTIGYCCPNIEDLSVSYKDSHGVIHDPPEGAFGKLKKLHLQCDSRIKSEDLQFLLRSCKELRELHLSPVQCLTDELMMELMRRNKFSDLEKIHLGACCLTARGFQTFLGRCPSLEYVTINSWSFPYEETERVIREVHPNVRVSKLSHIERFYRSRS